MSAFSVPIAAMHNYAWAFAAPMRRAPLAYRYPDDLQYEIDIFARQNLYLFPKRRRSRTNEKRTAAKGSLRKRTKTCKDRTVAAEQDDIDIFVRQISTL